jgi:hypothetical protein
LKEKCDNWLICEVFLFVVVNGEGRGGEKKSIGWRRCSQALEKSREGHVL